MNAVEEREEGLDVSRKRRRRRRRRRLCRIAVAVASGAVFVVASQYLVAQHAEGHLEQHRVGRALAEEVDEGVGGGGAVGVVVGADGGAVVRSSGAREVTLRRGRSAGRGKGGRSQRGGRERGGGAGRGVGSRRGGRERGGARRAPGARARALTFRYLRTNRIAYSSTVGSLAAISSRAACASWVCLVPTNQRPRGGTAAQLSTGKR